MAARLVKPLLLVGVGLVALGLWMLILEWRSSS